MAMLDVESSPHVVPPGYRIVSRFHLMPITVAGQRRWCEILRVVQRLTMHSEVDGYRYYEWEDVGYFDEVAPAPGKVARDDELVGEES
jgi:hypothetical protein